MHSVVFEFTPSSQGVNTSITIDAAKWNCDGAELSSCVITLFYWITYIYMFMFLMYCDLHA